MKVVVTLISIALFGLNAGSQLNADFTASPLTVCVGTPVSFTDQSSSSVISWAWNFGDGNTSNLENPSHTYSAAGNYNITLTVFDGATSVAEVKPGYITVNPLPVVGFTTPTTGCTVPYAPVFSGVSPGSGTYSYSWTFGNGQTSTAQTPTSANYVAAGTYNVNLTVTNTATGCVNSFDQDIGVFNFDTEFSVSSTTVCVGQLVSFFDESIGANDWDWDFGNGAGSGSANPVMAYGSPGTYTVTLESANSTNGCSGTFTQIITVNPLPEPGFTADPLFGCNPLVVDFTNTSVGAGTFQWNFGNGSTFTGPNPPNQTYSTVGVFDVTLTMTDANGCSKVFTQNDYIETEPLVSDFIADVYDGCEDLLVQFTDISTSPNPGDNPITGWNWNFGNGNTYSGQFPPVQTYTEGIYDVTLTVSTAGGCTTTYTLFDSITVGVPPNASFTYTPNSGCAKSDFEFTNTTPVPPGYLPSDIDFEWDFGDGGTSIEEDPTYDYPVDTGLFDVTLIVYFRGCPDTVVVEDAVYIDAPISLFSPQQMVYCNPTLPLIVPFTDNAILGETSDNVQMIWTWGDGGTNTLTSPFLFTNPTHGSMSHTYTAFGSYTVQQVVHNFTTGCSDSTIQTIHLSQIDASFSLTNDSVCRNLPLTMNSTSTSTHGLIWYDYYLDGDTLSGPDHTWSNNNSGTYPMTHLIINAVGCTDMANVSLVVLQEPVAMITPSDVSGCAPLTVVFTNSSAVVGNGADLDEFDWTFEDGSTETTTNSGQTTDYTFTATGNFTTSLVVTDEFGCISLPASVTTAITTPTAAFLMDSAICNHESFSATNTSTNFTLSEWFFDGVFVSDQPDYSNTLDEVNPSNLTGISHLVTLVVTDVNGCTDTLEKTITVSMPQVFADYEFTGSNINANGDFTCPPVFADLTDSTQSYGAIVQWNWSFGDDNFSTLQNPSNTYVFAGTYTAALVVTDEFGCIDSIVFPDYLTIGGPTGDVQWLLIGDACNPEYEFSAYNVSNVSNIHWTFGDGGEMDDVGPVTYVYNSPGSYMPTALLEDEFNCVIYFEMDVLTTAANVLFAEFDIVPDTVHVYDPMIIVDQSSGGSGGITTWTWTMDNHVFSYVNGDDVAYTWMFPGLHTVDLLITDTLGCTDTASHTVWVTADLFIPNVFTPNGDGINDFFVFDEPVFMQYDVKITNRWGVLMSEMTNQHGVYMWDGTDLGGDDCTAGTYFYTIEGITYYGQGISTYGEVTLVRNPHE